MMLSFGQIMGMVGRTLTSPREGAEEVLALGVPRAAVWIIIALVVVISVILAQITGLLIESTDGEMMVGLFGNPFITGVVQLLILLFTIGANPG